VNAVDDQVRAEVEQLANCMRDSAARLRFWLFVIVAAHLLALVVLAVV
jgi:hypothetical protein